MRHSISIMNESKTCCAHFYSFYLDDTVDILDVETVKKHFQQQAAFKGRRRDDSTVSVWAFERECLIWQMMNDFLRTEIFIAIVNSDCKEK